jgi:endonuclease-3 related protein
MCRRLLAAYGPQHWWPADEPFEVMVGAVLTQSTAWTNVAMAIANLKAAKALSAMAMRRLNADALGALIRPSGYYHVKTRRLKALVEWLGEQGDDLRGLFARDMPELRSELLAVFGIGEETADSILLYAAGKPSFVIDAYTRRIIDRVGVPVAGGSYGDHQRLFMDNLPADVALFNEYHALLVQHGKRTCRPIPRCPECCLRDVCRWTPRPG